MNKANTAQQHKTAELLPPDQRILQRKCACGNKSATNGECTECGKKKRNLQRKLSIGASNDPLELEADRVADQVMSMSPGTDITKTFPRIQRASVQSSGVDTTAPSSVERVLASSGTPMQPVLRQDMEQRFGHDFSNVRIHTGHAAEQSTRDVNAHAYTVGHNIVFGSGQFSPASNTGSHLLAHELSHTIQQGTSASLINQSAVNEPSTRNSNLQRTTNPVLQRTCADLDPRPAISCQIGTSTSGSSGTSILFGVNGAALSPAAKATIKSVITAWHTGGATGVLRIQGFASTEGKEEDNCPLSCNRANAVASELAAPSDGSQGITDPVNNLEIIAQGETNQFSSSLAPNRRVTINTSGGAPAPGPACGLTITGLNDVDHYCAAYVPSDAATCGVFPAPNVTLTAAGATAGTTPRWSIVRNTANASIVGASTGTTVDIKGDTASGAQGNVTVQVTDGTCTAMHFLTVREPSELSLASVATTNPNLVQLVITYTVRDQFGNPMGANICLDETVTVCADIPGGPPFNFGDAPTNANGQATDTLSDSRPGGIPANLCTKLNQSITAGGCGPLAQNTILFRPTGVVLTQNDSCSAGDPCP